MKLEKKQHAEAVQVANEIINRISDRYAIKIVKPETAQQFAKRVLPTKMYLDWCGMVRNYQVIFPSKVRKITLKEAMTGDVSEGSHMVRGTFGEVCRGRVSYRRFVSIFKRLGDEWHKEYGDCKK